MSREFENILAVLDRWKKYLKLQSAILHRESNYNKSILWSKKTRQTLHTMQW